MTRRPRATCHPLRPQAKSARGEFAQKKWPADGLVPPADRMLLGCCKCSHASCVYSSHLVHIPISTDTSFTMGRHPDRPRTEINRALPCPPAVANGPYDAVHPRRCGVPRRPLPPPIFLGITVRRAHPHPDSINYGLTASSVFRPHAGHAEIAPAALAAAATNSAREPIIAPV